MLLNIDLFRCVKTLVTGKFCKFMFNVYCYTLQMMMADLHQLFAYFGKSLNLCTFTTLPKSLSCYAVQLSTASFAIRTYFIKLAKSLKLPSKSQHTKQLQLQQGERGRNKAPKHVLNIMSHFRGFISTPE